ncbi:MAG: hypothetical protein WD645_05555 [Dehalococcoidia bacterium]
MTFAKHQARRVLALTVAMMLVVGMAACEESGGQEPLNPGTDPGTTSPGF